MSTKKSKTEPEAVADTAAKLSLTEDQMKVANMLVMQGAKLERDALIRSLSQYAGQAVSVDELIAALKKVQ